MGEKSMEYKIKTIRDLRDIQAQSYDLPPYNCGLYNGLELAVAIIEERKPNLVDIPEEPNTGIPAPIIPTQ